MKVRLADEHSARFAQMPDRRRVISGGCRVQANGRIWVGGTTWMGRRAIRISVSNWQTGDDEIDLAVRELADYAGKSPAR